MNIRRTVIAFAALALFAGISVASAQDKSIVVSSTTSTQDSGLFGHILPLFKAKTGIDVKVVSQGTGQALDTGRRVASPAANSRGWRWRAPWRAPPRCCSWTNRPRVSIRVRPRRLRTLSAPSSRETSRW